jgi:REP element-mobilizing transposase RayT
MLLSKLIGRFKMVTAKQINQINDTTGQPVWQRNYHEHIIRNEQAYSNIAEYIRTNPQKWQDDTYHV